MEWLMNISGIVNQKSNGGRKSFVLVSTRLTVGHDCGIGGGLFVSIFLIHPHLDGGNSLSDIIGVSNEFWEILDCSIWIIEIRLINEMPSGLPRSSVVLNLIGKGSTLNEWVLSFVLNVFWIIFRKNGESGVNLSKNLWVLSKDVIGDSGSD